MKLAKRPTAALIIAASSLCALSRHATAEDCSVQTSGFNSSWTDAFNITLSGFTSADIQTAANYWACPGYEGKIPNFQIGGSGGIPVSIVRRVGNSTLQPNGSCGQARLRVVNGQLLGADIEIWTHQADGISCAPLTDVIAHEFGHLLGLDHTEEPFGACYGHIMGGVFENQTRTVYSDDCEVADLTWQTTTESNAVDPYCDAYCWTNCINGTCPARPPGMDGCPILIDLENDGIRLTGLDDPVWFDIDADGSPDLMSWTDRGEGLLALDRDGNGRIDSGAELFGNHTRLSDGTRALNGYLALAEFDTWSLGGNGDGFIDSADTVFDSLRMWSDRNHDGVSQPEELQTLADAGVLRIGVDYKRSNRTDRYGNEFRFMGRAWKTGRSGSQRPLLTWDVFFVVAAKP